jgi:predicted phosphodiesterase
MRYYCISDIHGQYDKMIEALEDAGFNKETDTLISVGDLFDRGDKSKEVLEFVMSCPHRILCMGNHDLRLMQLIINPFDYNQYDYSNGVPYTMVSLIGPEKVVAENIGTWDGLRMLKENELLKQYFQECVAAIEFSNLIITHGWLPVNQKGFSGNFYTFRDDWREAKGTEWEEALWAHTEIMISHKLYPEKTMLIGHWHAWRLAEKFGEHRQTNKHDNEQYINCNSFTYTYHGEKKFIAIDGCTNWPWGGQVNVYDFESEETPQIIKGGFARWYY